MRPIVLIGHAHNCPIHGAGTVETGASATFVTAGPLRVWATASGQAFTPQFEGLTHYFRRSSRITKLGLVLISPAFLIIGTGHWLSLMLCWKPRWPKIIREAGLPGKPVPPLTTLDDYPPAIQERLRENAYLWATRPGKRPERKKRTSTRRPKSEVETPTAEKSAPCGVQRDDQP
ncbi:hypothetical protein [Pseudomonas fulva]|uniref:hypothetical protein n=1 Tax=Pseudomonas fulva TaxID=47880 RepID=UPI001E61639B|nr:hypothetical protein [Pseudomonas fulva]